MSHSFDPHEGFTKNKSVDHSYVPQKYSQNPVFEENQRPSIGIDSVQVLDCDIGELCSSGNELSSELMYTCVKNNEKFSVSQQMPANTRAKGLCGGTPLKASINHTNKGDGKGETNTNTNTYAPGMSV